MAYNLINILNPNFNLVSDTVISELSNVNPITKGIFSEDSILNITPLPSKYNLVDLTDFDYVNSTILSVVSNLIENFETPDLSCTLACLYPSGGYIGWHTNSNFNLYNAICTYSDTGQSYFEHYSGSTLVRTDDPIGWSVKKTYWDSNTPIKHRAVSNCNRITFTFSSKNENIIDSFINNITTT